MNAAWVWLKKYWEIIAGGFLLFLGVFLGWWLKKPVALETKDPERKEFEDEAVAEEKKILDKVPEEQQELRIEQAKEELDLIEEQKANVTALEKDPDATNDFLKQVGRSVRGDDNGGSK